MFNAILPFLIQHPFVANVSYQKQEVKMFHSLQIDFRFMTKC
ncbi:hypothetical protein TGS27_1472 [Geobacillus stearothermophilus]|nr:hypothetical protein TGS27_1472 [Geobacillus stearothermophilus]